MGSYILVGTAALVSLDDEELGRKFLECVVFE